MKTVENHQQVSKMEHLVRAQKTRQTAGRFLSSPPPGSGLTFQKRTDFGPPPPTPPRLASLRFAYTYTQAQAFGWLSWYIYIYKSHISHTSHISQWISHGFSHWFSNSRPRSPTVAFCKTSAWQIHSGSDVGEVSARRRLSEVLESGAEAAGKHRKKKYFNGI